MKSQDVSKAEDDSPEDSWWQFGPGTWLLIGGLVLFNIGCFLEPVFLDKFVYALDFRVWPWWYFLVVAVFLGFSIQWFRLVLKSEESGWSMLEEEAAKRFKRMASVVSVELIAVLVLHQSGFAYPLFRPFLMWCVYGTFSWPATIVLVLILAGSGITLYVLKEWAVTLTEQ